MIQFIPLSGIPDIIPYKLVPRSHSYHMDDNQEQAENEIALRFLGMSHYGYFLVNRGKATVSRAMNMYLGDYRF
jgi:hypothetical protein